MSSKLVVTKGPSEGLGYVPLHVLSYYSLLQGVSSPRRLVETAAALGMRALALTDENVLHGAVEFVQACRQYGVKPILGLNVTVDGNQVTLLAQNATGYQHLCRLSTAVASGSSLTMHHLTSMSDGLLLIATHRSRHHRWQDVISPDRLFFRFPLQPASESAVKSGYSPVAGDAGATTTGVKDDDGRHVFVRPVYYAARTDAMAKIVIDALRGGRAPAPEHWDLFQDEKGIQPMLGTPSAPTHSLEDAFFVSEFPGRGQASPVSGGDLGHPGMSVPLQQALNRTADIADMCDDDVLGHGTAQAGLVSWLPPPLNDGDEAPREDVDGDAELRRLVERGLRVRYGDTPPSQVMDRVDEELGVIAETGFAHYFLIVQDIVSFARGHGIPVGPGRGSSASSLVAYALGITEVDPLKYGLIFERFLNPQRVGMPDIDIDLCYLRRDEVIEYVKSRYGADRVAHICTFGTWSLRSALRDVGRLVDVPSTEVDALAQLIPPGSGVTPEQALEAEPRLNALLKENLGLRRLFNAAVQIAGVPRHMSTHAAGIVVAGTPLQQGIPLATAPDGTVVSQYKGDDLEALGMLKIDLLGLRTLTVIDQCLTAVRERYGERLNVASLPSDDAAVFRMLRQGRSEGVFQLETAMFQQLLREVRPSTFQDIIALLALGRPGPISWSDRHRIDPFMKSLFPETEGLMLYQEQVMAAAATLAGYTMGEADILRRAMGRKDRELMDKERNRFVEAAMARGHSQERAQLVFAEMSRFAGYGFAKSHAAAYALLTYATAYLKCRFPASYFVALCNSVIDDGARLARYTREAARMGVRVVGPDINRSDVLFTEADVFPGEDGQTPLTGMDDLPARPVMVAGLASVRHVGRQAAIAVVTARQQRPIQSIPDLLQRLPARTLHRKALDSLVDAGAFDSLYADRAAARQHVEGSAAYDGDYRRDAPGQLGLFDGDGQDAPAGVAAGTEGSLSLSVTERTPSPDGRALALSLEHIGSLQHVLDKIRRFPGRRPVVLTLEGEAHRVHLALPPKWWVSEHVEADDFRHNDASTKKE